MSNWQVINDVNDSNHAAAYDRLKRYSQASQVAALRGQHDGKQDQPAPRLHYHVNEGLQLAFNQALLLGMPLLLTGEPGTGKTCAAQWLAQYLKIELHRFTVRSNTLAEQLKFEFDAVRWLRNAHHPETVQEPGKSPRPLTRDDCLTHGPLWKAYKNKKASVVLIDEIDKAPRDFPNDLLEELDRHRFSHPFDPSVEFKPAGELPPIVIITSNGERALPAPFMRRCIWHQIKLNSALIEQAVKAQEQSIGAFDPALYTAARRRFDELRNGHLQQRPSLAEFLNWLVMLRSSGTTAAAIDASTKENTPCLSLLIKNPRDQQALR